MDCRQRLRQSSPDPGSSHNLTTLAPDIVAAIPDETLPQHVTVHELAISPPVLWEEQRERIGVVGEEIQPE